MTGTEDRGPFAALESPAESAQEKKASKPSREEDHLNLMNKAYEAYDPASSQPDTTLKERFVHESLTALGQIPVNSADKGRTAKEKEEAFMEATQNLVLLKLAELRKAQDAAIVSVTLPAGIKRMMAENYYYTVLRGKILKLNIPKEKSFRTIMEQYAAYAKDHSEGVKYYQQKARIAEAKSLADNFNKMFPAIAIRVELPQIQEIKKHGAHRDLGHNFGFIHAVRAILLMVELFNLEGKRLSGGLHLKLSAIYQDMLRFMEEKFLAECDQGEAMYEDPSDEYIQKIPWVTYENEGDNVIMRPFLYQSDGFFRVLLDLTAAVKPLTVKSTWKTDPESGDVPAAKA